MIVGSVLPSVLATASTIASVYRGTTELEGTAVAPVGAVEDRGASSQTCLANKLLLVDLNGYGMMYIHSQPGPTTKNRSKRKKNTTKDERLCPQSKPWKSTADNEWEKCHKPQKHKSDYATCTEQRTPWQSLDKRIESEPQGEGE